MRPELAAAVLQYEHGPCFCEMQDNKFSDTGGMRLTLACYGRLYPLAQCVAMAMLSFDQVREASTCRLRSLYYFVSHACLQPPIGIVHSAL